MRLKIMQRAVTETTPMLIRFGPIQRMEEQARGCARDLEKTED